MISNKHLEQQGMGFFALARYRLIIIQIEQMKKQQQAIFRSGANKGLRNR
jgi:hypothetical protein